MEISKKIYGDFGMTAYFMMRIMPPDFVICNIPYMEYIIENLEVLSETVKNTINIPIDIYNMNPVYLFISFKNRWKTLNMYCSPISILIR